MLVAEDLLLLLLDDETGRLATTHLEPALGGAVLVELALCSAVEVHKGTGLLARSKVRRAMTADTPADPLLDSALATVAEKDRTAQDLVNRLGKRLRGPLLQRLEQQGLLERRDDRVLGVFPRTRWPALDSTHEDDVRRRLADALLREATPDERTAALVALLYALDLAHRTVDREGQSAGAVKARAKAIAEGDWAAKAVRDAVQAAQAAMISAVAVAAGSVAAASS